MKWTAILQVCHTLALLSHTEASDASTSSSPSATSFASTPTVVLPASQGSVISTADADNISPSDVQLSLSPSSVSTLMTHSISDLESLSMWSPLVTSSFVQSFLTNDSSSDDMLQLFSSEYVASVSSTNIVLSSQQGNITTSATEQLDSILASSFVDASTAVFSSSNMSTDVGGIIGSSMHIIPSTMAIHSSITPNNTLSQSSTPTFEDQGGVYPANTVNLQTDLPFTSTFSSVDATLTVSGSDYAKSSMFSPELPLTSYCSSCSSYDVLTSFDTASLNILPSTVSSTAMFPSSVDGQSMEQEDINRLNNEISRLKKRNKDLDDSISGLYVATGILAALLFTLVSGFIWYKVIKYYRNRNLPADGMDQGPELHERTNTKSQIGYFRPQSTYDNLDPPSERSRPSMYMRPETSSSTDDDGLASFSYSKPGRHNARSEQENMYTDIDQGEVDVLMRNNNGPNANSKVGIVNDAYVSIELEPL